MGRTKKKHRRLAPVAALPMPAPRMPEVTPTKSEKQKQIEQEIREIAAWESYVQRQMKKYGQSRRMVGRRLRYGSFISGYRAGLAASRD